MEQNDIMKLGDCLTPMWIAAKDNISIKAPAVSLIEQVDANGNNINYVPCRKPV